MKCKKHPKYKGIAEPRSLCYECWVIYQQEHPERIPLYIPKNRWWKCSCHNKIQKFNYPMVCGKYYLCNEGSARLIWGEKIKDIVHDL